MASVSCCASVQDSYTLIDLAPISLLLHVSLLRYNIEHSVRGKSSFICCTTAYILMICTGQLHLEVRCSACLCRPYLSARSSIAQNGLSQRLRIYVFDTMVLHTSCKLFSGYDSVALTKQNEGLCPHVSFIYFVEALYERGCH
jgi:hypothetical protein